jgi:hypothetical protein
MIGHNGTIHFLDIRHKNPSSFKKKKLFWTKKYP